jgi:hypothetical protein
MDWDDYFRQQPAMYRQLVQKTEDIFVKHELLDLAAVCEEAAIISRIVGPAGKQRSSKRRGFYARGLWHCISNIFVRTEEVLTIAAPSQPYFSVGRAMPWG